MLFTVDVGLALVRPPKTDRMSRVVLESDSALDAELTAMHLSVAVHGAVMAVSSTVVDWSE